KSITAMAVRYAFIWCPHFSARAQRASSSRLVQAVQSRGCTSGASLLSSASLSGSLGEFDLSDEGFGDAGPFRVGRVDGESDAANVWRLFAENSTERVGNREGSRNGRTQLRPLDADEATAGLMVAPREGLVGRLGFTKIEGKEIGAVGNEK